MRSIAVVTTSYPQRTGDPEGHFVRTEALALAKAHRVSVFAPAASTRPRDNGVEVVEVSGGEAFGAPGLGSRLSERPDRVFGAVGFFFRLLRELESVPVDELIVHWPFPTALACRALTRRIPTTLVSHGACVRALMRIPRPLRDGLVARLLDGPAVRWRFVSEPLRAELLSGVRENLAFCLAAQSYVEPPAIVLPARQDLGSPWPRSAFVVLGRLIASKYVDRIVDFFSTTSYAATHDLVLVGDGPHREALMRRGRALGLRLHTPGTLPRNEALGLLAGADGLLFASRAEGLSTVLREAAHYGVKVIHVP